MHVNMYVWFTHARSSLDNCCIQWWFVSSRTAGLGGFFPWFYFCSPSLSKQFLLCCSQVVYVKQIQTNLKPFDKRGCCGNLRHSLCTPYLQLPVSYMSPAMQTREKYEIIISYIIYVCMSQSNIQYKFKLLLHNKANTIQIIFQMIERLLILKCILLS